MTNQTTFALMVSGPELPHPCLLGDTHLGSLRALAEQYESSGMECTLWQVESGYRFSPLAGGYR